LAIAISNLPSGRRGHHPWDALGAHFGTMREVGEPIPAPRTSVDYVEVAA
jgi:hypothetical protein